MAEDEEKLFFDDLTPNIPEIEALEPSSIANLLEGLPVDVRVAIWQQFQPSLKPDVLWLMHDESRRLLLAQLSEAEIVSFVDYLDGDHLVELYDDFSDAVKQIAVDALDSRQRHYFESALSYEEWQAGRVADRDIPILPANSKVRDATLLLKRKVFADYSHCVYLIDKAGGYVGSAKYSDLLKLNSHDAISSCIDPEIETIDARLTIDEAVDCLASSKLSALPAIDGNRLVGQISIDDLLDQKKEELESLLLSQVGLDEDHDLFSPITQSAKKRATWLGINLLTAFLAAWTIGLFQDTVEQVVALAVMMPVVASMGGIAGSQTLTLIIRGMAVGQITSASVMPLCLKELKVGLLNALLWSVVIALVTWLWFESFQLGLVIMVAITVNMVSAAYAGVWVPVLLKRFNFDPALAGSVLLTTVTDVIGFFTFLGLGSYYLI